MQYASAIYTANEDLTAVMPWSSTPEKTHGVEILSVIVCATLERTEVKVEFDASGVHKSSDAALIAALFVDDEQFARRTVAANPANPDYQTSLCLRYSHMPGDTLPHTYRIRVGPAGGVIRLNGAATGGLFGGTQAATLFVEAK